MARSGKGGKRPTYGSKRRLRKDGYIDIFEPSHPLARSEGYVFEHRKVAWDAGLLTDPADDVHHHDEDKTNNKLGNLRIKSRSQHAQDHAYERGAVKNQYGVFSVGAGIGLRYRQRRQALGARYCEICGVDITSFRLDATVCSSTCRVKRHRRSKAQRSQS